MTATPEKASQGSFAVLAEGWRLFLTGLPRVFPWVLVAELIPLLPFANPPGGLFTTDLSLFAEPGYLVRALLFGTAQTFLYTRAVLKLATLAGAEAPRDSVSPALRSIPSVLVAYLGYEVVVAIGLALTFVVFLLGIFIVGPLGGFVLCILPLAPTAAASTALALFLFPAVLEQRGPFASLGESSRLARISWVRVSVVISVPAVALLAAMVVSDFPAVSHAAYQGFDLWRRAQEGEVSTEELTGLLASFKSQPAVSRYDAWQMTGTLLGAFAWWYTLAVCYAQYRDLKARDRA